MGVLELFHGCRGDISSVSWRYLKFTLVIFNVVYWRYLMCVLKIFDG